MRLIKHIINSIVIVALALLGTGCAADEPGGITGGGLNEGLSDENSYYIAFDILTASEPSSRASGDLEDGSEVEHAIGQKGNYALFFDGKGTLMNITPLDLSANGHVDHPTGNIEARYWTVINPWKGNLPSSALIVVNAENIYSKLTSEYAVGTATVGQVMGAILSNSENPWDMGRDGELFTMTNTAYVKDGAAFCAVPVTEAMFHLIEDINQPVPDPNLKEEEILKVRVERLHAKVTADFQNYESYTNGHYIYKPIETESLDYNHQVNLCTGWIETSTSINYQDAKGNTVTKSYEDWAPKIEVRDWKAELVSWDMNALERETYLFKNISQGNYDSFYGAWNDKDNYRSYWAEDPNYNVLDYPWQYRKAVNYVLTDYGTKDGSQNTNQLLNFSYNTMAANGFRDKLYIPENTYDLTKLNGSSLDGRRDLLAGTHLIVCAKLLIDDGNGKFEAMDVYRGPDGVYYTSAQDCLWGLVRAFNYALASQQKMRYQLYDWNSSGEETTGMTLYGVPIEGGGGYQLYYNGDPMTYDLIMKMSDEDCKALLVAATIKDGDGKRVLKSGDLTIENASGGHLPIYMQYLLGYDDETHQPFDEENQANIYKPENRNNHVISLILEWSGAPDHFNEGLMYYKAPATIIPGTETADGVYGVVRNAWYKYTLTGIKSVGIPVDDPSQRIVPNWTAPYDDINLNVTIIGWHEIGFEFPRNPY
ncbi:MAG: fimbria major subunit [Paramuribaculum sp.]|nr:fimbria major subunit [Paramuribaculum sp.]